MRTKNFKINKVNVECTLLSGGPNFKIYSVNNNTSLLLVVNRLRYLIAEDSPKYTAVINYVNIRYQPMADFVAILKTFDTLINSLLNSK